MTRRVPVVPLLGLLGAALVAGLLSPEDAVQGDLARLLNVHVPAAWVAYLAFGVTFVASIGYLLTRRLSWDRIAAASAELGVVFTGLTIFLGMIWGRPIWGVYWTWDARLTATAVMFFVYLGYLALRRSIPDRQTRARRSAILGIVAIAQLPVVHFSVYWWRTLHQPPTLLRPDEVQMDTPFLVAFLAAFSLFTVIYALLLRSRIRIEELEAEADELMASSAVVAGDAVSTPTGRPS
ncbi:MAG: cytochrome c biogenesis protein CcsA [Acidimicrobiia bacterium]|nr:cytochrome c biogenesis protein CcsA [Acidimicrobiia bacterium]MBT8215016.1 cytochrome c biogenesis protein CcsA [Acidimicrobiia bacterium]